MLARPARARAHARRGPVRDRRAPHRRRAGDVPRRRSWRPAPRRARAARRARRPALHDRARRSSTSRSTSTRSTFSGDGFAPDARRSSTRCSTGARRAPAARASSVVLAGHPADDPQARPRPRRTWCRARATWQLNEAISEPARRRVRASTIKGLDELRHAPRLGDGRGVQLELPGPPPGRRPTSSPRMYNIAQVLAGPMLAVRHELAAAVRPPAVGRDPHRAVPAGGRHPPAEPPPARARGARQLRHRWVRELGRRDLPGGHRPLPPARRHGPRGPTRSTPSAAARLPQLKALRLHNGTI